MLEAKIILPTNCGYLTHSLLRLFLAQHFGGYTATHGDGGWLDSAGELVLECVTVYVVAMEPSIENSERLLEYVATLARDSNQESVYVKLPYGNVFLIPAKK